MIAPSDMEYCRQAVRHGSLSFHAASRLLPASVRDPALALYAFCRLADDEVDLKDEKAAAVLSLEERLDRVYAGRPRDAAPDRAFAAIVEDFDMPRALPEALLEGLAWDAMGRRYSTLSELTAYSARVASAVGAMMCVLMRVRDRNALARACNLGAAMQFTNIARDVGEDAEAGRLYLPLNWFQDAGLSPDTFLADPTPRPEIRNMVRRLLREAGTLYAQSESGISALPMACRPGIFAARYIYAGIGGRVRAAGHDSVSRRARTSTGQKMGWLALSVARTAASSVLPPSPLLYARPLPETEFLIKATAVGAPERRGWSDTVVSAMAQLKAKDRDRRAALMERQPRVT